MEIWARGGSREERPKALGLAQTTVDRFEAAFPQCREKSKMIDYTTKTTMRVRVLHAVRGGAPVLRPGFVAFEDC